MENKPKPKAGHLEIIGETIAKFELFDNGWNPYSRFLDTDKVDILLRRTSGKEIHYREVQVKYGKLYHKLSKWEYDYFDVTSFRFFNPKEFDHIQNNLFIFYVLHLDSGYKGDVFIFPIKDFRNLLKEAVKSKQNVKLYMSRLKGETTKWILRKSTNGKDFKEGINDQNSIDISMFYRNFRSLD